MVTVLGVAVDELSTCMPVPRPLWLAVTPLRLIVPPVVLPLYTLSPSSLLELNWLAPNVSCRATLPKIELSSAPSASVPLVNEAEMLFAVRLPHDVANRPILLLKSKMLLLMVMVALVY